MKELKAEDTLDLVDEKSEKIHEKIRNTKKSLAKSLIKLLQEKPVTQIDVSELCKNANLNRTTFYNHYSSIYALLDEMVSEFFKNVKKYLADSIDEKSENTAAKISLMLKYLKQNRRFVRTIMNNNLYEEIGNKLISFDFVSNLLNTNIKYRQNIYINDAYYIGFIISGWYAVIKRWVNEDCDLDENTLARLLTSIY